MAATEQSRAALAASSDQASGHAKALEGQLAALQQEKDQLAAGSDAQSKQLASAQQALDQARSEAAAAKPPGIRLTARRSRFRAGSRRSTGA